MNKFIFNTLAFILLVNFSFCQTEWQEINAPPGTSHNRVHFYDDLNGYIIANEKNFYKTTDGAETWTLLNTPMGTGGKIYSFYHLTDNTTIYVVGCNYTEGYGRIYKSSDSGETWELKNESNDRFFKGVYFVSELVGWAWADKMYDSYLYKTEDAGETWTEIYTTNKWIRSLFFLTEDIGWRCSRAGGHVAKTEDGGYTWVDQLNEPGIYEGMNDILFLNDQVGFVAGDERSFLKTMDGGESWEYLSSEDDPGIMPPDFAPDWAIKDIYFVDEYSGWIVGGPC